MLNAFQQKFLECAHAGLEPRWSNICELLRSEFQGDIASVVLLYKTGASEVLGEATNAPAQVRPYREANQNGTTASEQNPYLAEAVRTRRRGESSIVSAADLLIPLDKIKESAFFKNHLAQAGMNDAVGALVFDGERVLGKASVLRQSRGKRYGAQEIDKFKSITQYIIKGLLASRAVRELEPRAHAGKLILLNQRCGLLVYNPLGDLLLKEGFVGEIGAENAAALRTAVRAFALERNLVDRGSAAVIHRDASAAVIGEIPPAGGPMLKFRLEAERRSGRMRVFCYINSEEAPASPIYTIPAGIEVTRRERDVLEYLINGMDNSTIAKNMGIAVYTVKDHLKSIFSKLEVHTRAGAVALLTRGVRPQAVSVAQES